MNMCRVLPFLAIFALTGCINASDHQDAVRNDADKLTVGKVQRQISVGMTGGDVAQVLGSPNIVTTGENRTEVWVYDKISTDTAYSTSSGGISSLILGGGSDVIGGIGGGYKKSAGATSQNQKTLTIVIKFDEKGLVKDFSYNTSSF